MFTRAFVKKYLVYALVASAVYCIPVVLFLYQQNFQSIWLLYLGNALYLLAIALIVFFHNRAQHFRESAVTSAISGHVLSLTGASLSVVLSLLLYWLFSTGLFSGHAGEILKQAPSQMNRTGSHGMLFVLIVNAALGNTITGFFAAIFTSFGASNKQMSEQGN